MEEDPMICRICFAYIGENSPFIPIINNSYILQNLNLIAFATIRNLQLTDDPLICHSCLGSLKEFAHFKENVITNEFQIQCHQKKDNIFLKSLAPDSDHICRLCLCTGPHYTKSWKDNKKMFLKCNIHLNLHISKPSKMCDDCFGMLDKMYKFICNSIERENEIVLYFTTHKKILENKDILEVSKSLEQKLLEKANAEDDSKEPEPVILDPKDIQIKIKPVGVTMEIEDNNNKAGPSKKVKKGVRGRRGRKNNNITTKVEPEEETQEILDNGNTTVDLTFTEVEVSDTVHLTEQENNCEQMSKETDSSLTAVDLTENYENVSEMLKDADAVISRIENEYNEVMTKTKLIEILEEGGNVEKCREGKPSPKENKVDASQTKRSARIAARSSIALNTQDEIKTAAIKKCTKTIQSIETPLDTSLDQEMEQITEYVSKITKKNTKTIEKSSEKLKKDLKNNTNEDLINILTGEDEEVEINKNKMSPRKSISFGDVDLNMSEGVSLRKRKAKTGDSSTSLEIQDDPTANESVFDFTEEEPEDLPPRVPKRPKSDGTEENAENPLTESAQKKKEDEIMRLIQNAFEFTEEEDESEPMVPKKLESIKDSTKTGDAKRTNNVLQTRILKRNNIYNDNETIKKEVEVSNLEKRILSQNKNKSLRRKSKRSIVHKLSGKGFSVIPAASPAKHVIDLNTKEDSLNDVHEELNDSQASDAPEEYVNETVTITNIVTTDGDIQIHQEDHDNDEDDFLQYPPESTILPGNRTPSSNVLRVNMVTKRKRRSKRALEEAFDRLKEGKPSLEDLKTNKKPPPSVSQVEDTLQELHSLFSDTEKGLECLRCSYKTKSLDMFNQHKLIHTVLDTVQKFKCQLCSFQCKTKEQIDIHNLSHKQRDVSEQFECLYCDFKARKKITLINHVVHHEAELSPEEFYCVLVNDGDGVAEKMFECLQCNEQTESAEDMKTHVRGHNNPAPPPAMFRCDSCQYKTKNEDRLQRHKALKHPNKLKKRFKCTICKFTTNYQKTLTKHLMDHEKNPKEQSNPLAEKQLKCNLCKYLTLNKRSLVNHMTKKHNKKQIPIEDVKPLLTKKTDKTGQDFKCTKCPYVTSRKIYLIRHLVVHKTKENLLVFECTHCRFETKHRRSYTRHMEVKHKVVV